MRTTAWTGSDGSIPHCPSFETIWQHLKTTTAHRTTKATRGQLEVPPKLVSELEAHGHIACREVWHKGGLYEKICNYMLTEVGRNHAIEASSVD